MPTYDYVCGACGAELEVFQSMRENALKKCPTCKKLKLERRIGTGGGVLFKGSGFYQTDYRSESYKSGADNDKPKCEGGSADKGSTDKGSCNGPCAS